MDFDLRGEFQIGGAWVDATGNLLTRQSLTHTRGRPDLGARVDPSTCRPLINNTSGQFSPDNPLSPYYGQFGRNTPFRLSLHAGSAALELSGGAGDYASTPDHSSLDITGDLDIRLEASFPTWRGDTTLRELAGKYEATGNQESWALFLWTSRGITFRWTADGSTVLQVLSSPLPVPASGRMAIRITLDVDNGAAGNTTTFYTAPSISGPWTQLGDPAVQSGTTSVFSGTAPLVLGDVTATGFERPVGRVHAFELRNGINGTVVANPDFGAQTPGATSFVDGAGRTWTVTGGATISNRRTRLTHELTAYPTRWHPSGAHVWVPAETRGILRRYGRAGKALDSTLRRRIPSYAPLAYWPMEDGQNATQASSPINGVSPLTLTRVNWASADTLPSSRALPVLASAGGVLPQMLGRIPVPTSTLTSWSVRWIYRLDTPNATQRTYLRIRSTGTVADWYIQTGSGGSTVFGNDRDGNLVFTQGIATGTDLFGQWIYVRFAATQNGGNVDWRIDWQDVGGDAGGVGTSFAGTVGRPTVVASPPDGYSADLDGMAIGHISAWASNTTAAYDGAIDAWSGETAGARMERLASEEGVPVTVCGDIGGQTLVGPQLPSPVLDLLQEAADADGGILYEDREQAALRYRNRAGMYNQAPALVLDYNGPGLAKPLEPTGDDDATQNDVTVQRAGGSSGRAVLEEGALSIQAPPAGVGTGYDVSYPLNLHSDEQTESIAYWLLHLGTYEGRRYPQVRVMVHQAPALVDQILSVDVGDKIVIQNPPAWLPPGDIELIVQGYEETFKSSREWDIVFNCTPAVPWTVGEVATVEDFEDTTYEVTAADGGNLPWARSSAHFNSGSWSLRSGAILDNQTSDWIVSVPGGATEMRFWYWTSSEAAGAGFEGDRLLVLVDGTQVLRAQGTTPWTQAIVDVSAASTVTFRYAKDNSAAAGEDAVHIDDLSFTGRGPAVGDTSGAQLAADATNTATSLPVLTTAGRVWTTNPVAYPLALALGGEEVTATACTSGVKDAFGRTVTDGWGSADIGGAWTNSGGAATDYDVTGTAGTHTLTSVNVSRRSALTASSASFDLHGDIAVSALATGGSLAGAVMARYTDGNNLYMARLEFTTAAAVVLTIRSRVAGVETELGTYTTGLTHVAGSFYRVRFQGSGTSLKAKAWAAAGTEPDLWQVEVTDSALTAAGSIGVRSIAFASNTNVNPVVSYDNVELTNPQTITAVRSANGIVKAQTAGTAVSLAQPAAAAL